MNNQQPCNGSAVQLAAPKWPPGIWLFSIAMGSDYSFELISIETYALQFIGHNNFFLGSVGRAECTKEGQDGGNV